MHFGNFNHLSGHARTVGMAIDYHRGQQDISIIVGVVVCAGLIVVLIIALVIFRSV